MAVSDKAQVLKQSVQAQIDDLAKEQSVLKQQSDLIDGLLADNQAEVQEAHDKGFAEGKASVVLPDPNSPDKLFTQADMDKLAAEAKAEQQAADAKAQADAIAAIQVQLDASVKVQADLKASLDQANKDKADLQAQLDAEKAAHAEASAKLSKDESEIAQVKAVVNEQPAQS